MRKWLVRTLGVLLVFCYSVAAHAENLKLVCDLPAASGQANGDVANIRADHYTFEICEGCRVYAPRASLEAYYAKNNIKPAIWHITDTRYQAEEDGADQNGNMWAHSVFTISRADGTFQMEYTWHGAKAISNGKCKKFEPIF